MTEQERQQQRNNTAPHWGVSLAVIVIGAFLVILDSSIVNIAVPTLMDVFQVSTENVQWVVTIYMLTLGVIVPVSGWLGDKLGYKKLYIYALVIFTIASALCGLAWNFYVLIAARVLQAVGGGLIMPSALAMIFRLVPRNRQGTAMGIWGMAVLVAPALGPTIGGYLVEYVNWRLIFFINIPIGILGYFIAGVILPEFEMQPAGPFDTVGFLSSAVGLFSLIFALAKGESWGWTSQPIILLFYVSIVSLAIFVYNELTVEYPMLELRIFRYGVYTASRLVNIIIMVSLYSQVFYLPLYLQNIRGLGAMETGFLLMPGALATGIMMFISGRIYDRIGALYLSLAGISVLAYTSYLLSHLNVYTAPETVVKWVILRGIGMGLVSMPAQTAGMAVIPKRYVGHASAASNVIQRVSASFGLAVLTSFLTGRVAFHQSMYRSEITPWSPVAANLFSGFGGLDTTAVKLEAAKYLQAIVFQKAFTRGVDELFLYTSLLCVLGLVPAMFLRRRQPR